MITVNKKELVLAAGFVVFGISCLLWIIPTFAAQLGEAPSLLPAMMAALISVLGAAAAVRAIVVRPQSNAHDSALDDTGDIAETARRNLVWISVLVLSLFAWFAEQVGFVVGAAIASSTLLYAFGVRKAVRILVISLAFSGSIFVLFDILLDAPLPRGWLSSLL